MRPWNGYNHDNICRYNKLTIVLFDQTWYLVSIVFKSNIYSKFFTLSTGKNSRLYFWCGLYIFWCTPGLCPWTYTSYLIYCFPQSRHAEHDVEDHLGAWHTHSLLCTEGHAAASTIYTKRETLSVRVWLLQVSIVGSLRDREVACSASDRQGSNFESCVWRTVSSQSSHHPQEVLLAQFSLYVHKGGLKPDSFHFCCDFYSAQKPLFDPQYRQSASVDSRLSELMASASHMVGRRASIAQTESPLSPGIRR